MELLILFIYVMIFAISIFEIVCMWITYKKVGAPGWAIFIPIYNYVVLFQVANVPMWMILLLFIPVVNLYPLYLIYTSVAERLGKNKIYGILLLFVPYIAYPILAFSKEEVESIYVNVEDETPQVLMDGPIEPLGAMPDELSNANNEFTQGTTTSTDLQVVDPSIPTMEPTTSNISAGPLTAQQSSQHIPEEKEVYPDVNVFKTCPDCGTKLEPTAEACFLCGKRFDV